MNALLLALGLWLLPVAAQATAGFAETHDEAVYNEFAGLHWIHPGDGCDEGKYCFQVHRPGEPYQTFNDLTMSLIKINRPSLLAGSLVMGQTASGGRWFVYDLASQAFVAPPGEEDAALDAWINRGLKAPEFWDAKEGGPGLRRTTKSFLEDTTFLLFLVSPFLVVLGLPLGLWLGVRSWRRFRQTRRAGFAVATAVFAIPCVLVILIFVRVFLPVVWR